MFFNLKWWFFFSFGKDLLCTMFLMKLDFVFRLVPLGFSFTFQDNEATNI